MRFPYVNEWREVETAEGRFVISRIGVATTPVVSYTAWEPVDGHSTQTTTLDGERLGAVHTRRLPERVEEMRPGTPERIGAYAELLVEQERIAREAIMAAFPEVVSAPDARVDGARIETCENAGAVA